jgi:hypothetical protein
MNATIPHRPVSARMLRALSKVKRALMPVTQTAAHTASTTSVENSSRVTAGRLPWPG